MRKLSVACAMAAFLCASAAFAGGGLQEEIADLKAKVASLESAQMAPAAGGCESLTSMKKKGQIKIGGSVEIDVAVIRRDDIGDTVADDDDEVNSTYFGTGLPYDSGHGAYLDFEIAASADTLLYIKLDLDDMWNESADQDDLLEEVYFQWSNIRGSNWDVIFGKKVLDYGMDKYVGVTPSFHDGWAYLLTGLEAVDNVNGANAHDQVGSNSLPTAYFNCFQVEAIYHYKDLANFYMTLFQNNDSTGGGRATRGMHEDRSDDTLFFQSFALKAELMPIEGLTLQASVVNYHNDSNGDKDNTSNKNRGADAEENQYAVSIGADYTFKSVPLNMWIEYQHGFDWGYDDDCDTDTLGIGATWSVTEAIDLSILGEWAAIDDAEQTLGRGSVLRYDDEDYFQIVMTAAYKFDNGIFVALEYAHQWYDGDLDSQVSSAGVVTQMDDDLDREADMIAFRTGWSF